MNEKPNKEIFKKFVKNGWDKLSQEEKKVMSGYKEHGFHLKGLATLSRCAGFGGSKVSIVSEGVNYILSSPHWKPKNGEIFKCVEGSNKSQKVSKKEFEEIYQHALTGIDQLIDWYYDLYFEKHQDHCCYCGISQKDLDLYFNTKNSQYKDARQRGKWLEVERLITAPKENNLYQKNNCALACYICNNAKSDFISPKDFEPIAKGINGFWQKVLKEKNQDYSYLEKFEFKWAELEKKLQEREK